MCYTDREINCIQAPGPQFHPGGDRMTDIRTNRIKFPTRILILVAVLVLTFSAVLGLILVRRSREEMLDMIHARMLDIANTAAALLDGDDLASLTAEDAGTPAFRRVMETLTCFQDNIDLEYIYIIRDMKDGTFTFGPDPTVEDPGEFGSPIQYTPALATAAAGTPAVDTEPYTDAWGRFYSAYTPVFTSSGEVGGIVAVDFDAEWLEKQVRESTRVVWIGCLVSLAIGILLVSLLTETLRKRLKTINNEISELSASVDALSRELSLHAIVSPDAPASGLPEDPVDDVTALSLRLRVLRERVKAYTARAQMEATMDKLTGANNQSSYVSLTRRLDKDIRAGLASFSLTIFDLDRLKEINDEYGHDAGDRALSDAARLISQAFGAEHTYRVGGDEFAAILENRGEADASMRISNLKRLISEFNQSNKAYPFELSLSMGSATYDAEADDNFRSVFRRADRNMYSSKKIHHDLARMRSEQP